MERYYLGKNYHFFVPGEDGAVAIGSEVKPFYSFPPEKVPPLPALISDSLAIPRFLYELTWEGHQRRPKPIFLPNYIQYDNQGSRLIMTHARFPPGSYWHGADGKEEIKGGSCLVTGSPPFIVEQGDWATQVGAIHQKGIRLYYRYRRHIEAAEYISLRDMVNPEWDHNMVYKAVDELFLENRLKQGLFRLIKILYAGDGHDEINIVRNIYSREPEFARLIYEALFNIEIVPVIHGPFLQKILSALEDETIAAGLAGLSPGLGQVVRQSVSKNRFSFIESMAASSAKKPRLALSQVIEMAIAKQFARRILYEPVEEAHPLNQDLSKFQGPKGAEAEVEFKQREKLFIEESAGDYMHEEFIGPYLSGHINFTCRPLSLRILAASAQSVYVQALRPLDYLRFDYWHNNYSWSEKVFINLRSKTIVEIPRATSDKGIIGAAVTRGGFPVEFQLMTRDI